jgi:4-hydroxy-3-methylbut-2-enyl diphosphate reductase
VKTLASECEVMLVVGSPNSSNSNRLRELGERMGAKSHLIDNASEIEAEWLDGVKAVGITAGASAPDILVREVVDKLVSLGGDEPEELQGREENVVFSLPKELRMKRV